jgi:2-polyprenyl-3-methyl-5-hydroxy-6-metoxy-1,4-benzoquinol methylase
LITVKSALEADLQASDWVTQHVSNIRPRGRILDYACGTGRHAIYLATQGYEVLAIDRNPQVLQEITNKAGQLQLNIKTQLIDLEQNNWPFSGSEFAKSFDGVVVTNYLYRPFLM